MIFICAADIAVVSGACSRRDTVLGGLQRGRIVALDLLDARLSRINRNPPATAAIVSAARAAQIPTTQPGRAEADGGRHHQRPPRVPRHPPPARRLGLSPRWLGCLGALCLSALVRIPLPNRLARPQHRWGSAGGCQHLLPSVVSWVIRIADVVLDAVGSDHLAAGRAVDASTGGLVPECRCTGWAVVHCTGRVPWPGGLSGSLVGAVIRRRRQLVGGQRVDPVVDRRRRNHASRG